MTPSTLHFSHRSYHKVPEKKNKVKNTELNANEAHEAFQESEAAHLGDIFHSAIRAGDAVAATSTIEMESDFWRGLWYSAAKHCGFSHGHGDVFRPSEVTERSGAWC